MRMSTDASRDEEKAFATIAAAVEAGVTVFDTARAYGLDADELGHNERLLARGLRQAGAGERARVVTKGGMRRDGGAWITDGRARAIRADCEASLVALDGLPIDLYLVHAPDPRTSWRTSLRSLARLVADGLVQRVGVSNVNRDQLDEALALAPVAAVQVALSPFDDRALRGGVLDRCEEAGIALIAHSPLGGPRRAAGLARRHELAGVAEAHGASAAEVALAWLLDLSPAVVAIPGARRPETAHSAAGAAALELDASERAALAATLGRSRPKRDARPRPVTDGEVVLVMGIPGAGKSGVARDLAGRGYVRLNRDERGGSLRDLARTLESELSTGTRRVVLDNTYLSRAARSHVVETASRHGHATRCVWLDTPLAQAQVNLVERLLERFGLLPSPDELREAARGEPGLLAPTSQMRALRELEPPTADEGFASIERVPFARDARPGQGAVLIAAAALDGTEWTHALAAAGSATPCLVFDWLPGGTAADLAPAVERIAANTDGPVAAAVCPHGGGPPVCWCRPPLPGLLLAFAREHGVDPARAVLVGTSPAHRTLATTLGAGYVQVEQSERA
jgi:aryl-alcohol dehydrogenase-like predicted oxidoreductase